MIFYCGKEIHLRSVERKDLPKIASLRNSVETWPHLTDPIPVTEKDQEAWFSSISLRSGRFWAIACNKEHDFIGLARMDQHDAQNRSLRIGVDVEVALRGLGFGTKTYRTLFTYVFDELNIHRLWLQVLETNERGIHLYDRLGFKKEGILRDAVFRRGSYVGYIVMSILEQEYRR